MKIYKEDYKHFRTCKKLAWFLNEKKYELAIKLLNDKKIINFIELTNTKTSSKMKNESKITNIKDFSATSYQQTFSEQEETDFYLGETLADGLETGKYAQQFFSKKYRCYNFENGNYKFIKTWEILQNKAYDVFFEPRFEYNNCVTKCDILKRNGTKWDIIEVKAVTSVKEEHMWDLLYQCDILSKSGLVISNVYIMYLNNNYVLQEKLNLAELFITYGTTWQKSSKSKTVFSLFETINSEISSRNLAQEYETIKKILVINDQKAALALLTEKYCHDDQKQWCFHIFPFFNPVNTIFQLYRLRKKKKALWYYEENLLTFADQRLLPFIVENKMHLRQHEVYKNPAAVVNWEYFSILQQELAKYQYPVYMYDFETMKSAVPKFNFSRPYQQIPFQYSVHVLLGPDFDFETNYQIKHYEFLADGITDPRTELVKNLCHDLLDIHGIGVYVAYNKSFEKSVIKNLIAFVPEAKSQLSKIFTRTIDLQDFFKDFKIYKTEFCGSLSIKKTLPAFAAQFSYQDLKINKGDMASEIFRRRVENNITLSNWNKNFRSDMLQYCARDTWGMVVLFWYIKKLLYEKEKIWSKN